MICNKKIEEIADIYSGIKAYEVGKGTPPQTEAIRNEKPYTSNIQESSQWKPFFEGKHINRYGLNWQHNNWIHYGPWLAAPRNPEQFKGEKILIRKIVQETLIATYVPYDSYCNTLLFILKKKNNIDLNLKSLLGLLNSNFIGWFFRQKFQISHTDTFPQIMARDIVQFPLPTNFHQSEGYIGGVVDKVLEVKMKDSQANIVNLERQIDLMVYKLYNLTYDEVKIVEPDFSMSEVEYNNFTIEGI